MPDHGQLWVAAVHDPIAQRGSIGTRATGATGAPRLSAVIERKVRAGCGERNAEYLQCSLRRAASIQLLLVILL